MGLTLIARSYTRVLPRWTAQDYIWLQICYLTITNPASTPSLTSSTEKTLTLPELQHTIVQYGPAHFNRSGALPLLLIMLSSLSKERRPSCTSSSSCARYSSVRCVPFCVTLFLTQMQAISYVSSLTAFPIESVHFLIALHYYGLIPYPKAHPGTKVGADGTLSYVGISV